MTIIKRGSEWLVLSKSTGKVLGRHSNRQRALSQLAAIEISKSRKVQRTMRRRPREHFRRVRTKRGRKRITVNRGVRGKPRNVRRKIGGAPPQDIPFKIDRRIFTTAKDLNIEAWQRAESDFEILASEKKELEEQARKLEEYQRKIGEEGQKQRNIQLSPHSTLEERKRAEVIRQESRRLFKEVGAQGRVASDKAINKARAMSELKTLLDQGAYDEQPS